MVAAAIQAAMPQIVSAVATALVPSPSTHTEATGTSTTDGTTNKQQPGPSGQSTEAEAATPMAKQAKAIQEAATVSHIETLLGEDEDNSNNPNFRKFTSSAVPLHLHVSEMTQQKIKEGKYVDFATLLPNHHDHSDTDNLQLKIQMAAGQPKIVFEKQNQKKIYTIVQWQKAFDVYTSIYLEQFPQHAIPLIRYGQTIRDLHAKGFNWRLYDTEFRRLRQLDLDGHPWDRLDYELWAFAMHQTSNYPYQNQSYQSAGSSYGPVRPRMNHNFQPRPRAPYTFTSPAPRASHTLTSTPSHAPRPRFPNNTCWQFQSGKRCNAACRFADKHLCCWCGGNHPAVSCQSTNPRPANPPPKHNQ